MRTFFFTLLLSSIFIFGCNNSNQKKQNKNNEQVESAVQVILPNDSNIIFLKLNNGFGKANVRKEKNQTIYLEFASSGYKNMRGYLLSDDSLANIRFTQIFMPDGTADGPFGREIRYELPVDGIYRLSVNENMMAGDPWEGEFSVDIQLYD